MNEFYEVGIIITPINDDRDDHGLKIGRIE